MLKNAYLLAKIGADTAENEQHFAEILPIGSRGPSGREPEWSLTQIVQVPVIAGTYNDLDLIATHPSGGKVFWAARISDLEQVKFQIPKI